jgi:bisphosphoglycerate-independent phosphoglycerate mutase (AlkP superfamily)
MRTILLFFLLFEKAVKASSFFLAQVSEAGVHAAQDARQKQENEAAAEEIQKVVLHQMK